MSSITLNITWLPALTALGVVIALGVGLVIGYAGGFITWNLRFKWVMREAKRRGLVREPTPLPSAPVDYGNPRRGID